MAKYTLTCEHDEGGGTLKQVTEFRTDFLPEVLENFELFLRGCGFYFDGHVDIIDEDQESFIDELEESYDSGAFSQVVKNHMDFLDSKRADTCSVCGLSSAVMQGQKCFDPACPKDEFRNAN